MDNENEAVETQGNSTEQETKTFTQEEVDSIVNNRLSRQESKLRQEMRGELESEIRKEIQQEQNLTKNIPEVIAFGNIKYDNANILLSFPSKNEFILVEQLAILDNLEDCFTLEFQETKSIGYFIRTIVTLPLKLLKYLGFI